METFLFEFGNLCRGAAPQAALTHLREIVTFYRFLGSYATDKPRDPQYRKRKV